MIILSKWNKKEKISSYAELMKMKMKLCVVQNEKIL